MLQERGGIEVREVNEMQRGEDDNLTQIQCKILNLWKFLKIKTEAKKIKEDENYCR